MKNFSGQPFLKVVLFITMSFIFLACQPEEEDFISLSIKQGAVFYVAQSQSIDISSSSNIDSIVLSLDGGQEWSVEIIEGQGAVNIAPAQLGDGLILQVQGFNKEMAMVISNEYIVHVVQEPGVDVASPLPGQEVTSGEEFLLAGSFEIGVAAVEVLFNGELVALMSEAQFSFPFAVSQRGGKAEFKFLFKDIQGRVVKTVVRVVEVTIDADDISEYFPLEAPISSELGSEKSLWSTYYYLHQAIAIEGGIPMRDMNNNRIGPELASKDWCYSAMEGSVHVTKLDGTTETYNYAGTTSSYNINCSAFFSHRLGRTKFRKANGTFGDGVRSYKLIPFRTIAVDPNHIAYGTVIYIPAARGNEVQLPDGTTAYHDGYFFAGDTGGAIKTNHIDTFIGVAKRNPFSWIKSSSSGSFEAYIVTNPVVIDYLTDMH